MEDTFHVKSLTRRGAVAYVRRNIVPDQKVRVLSVEDLGQSGDSRMWAVTVGYTVARW